MMLKPSIDTLLDKVPSKYSLVILEAKRAHELEEGAAPTQEFKSVKSTLRALEGMETLGFTQILRASGKQFVDVLKQNAYAKKKKNVKSKNKLPRKKKRAKKFKIGSAQSYFFFY